MTQINADKKNANLRKSVDKILVPCSLFIIISVVLYRCYNGINMSYPFYFIWDMDHQVLLDLLQINSGSLPSNLTHPGFGIKLLLYLTHKTAYALKYISISGFNDLYKSVSPLACVAELTDFYRRHSPVLAILTVLFLWSSLNIIFKPKWWVSLFVLIFLGFQESLFYHSAMIRSELYCVFYWSCAVFFSAYAANASNRSLRNISLVLAGMFAGLSLLTKVQAVMYIFFIMPFFAFNMLQDKNTEETNRQSTLYFYLCAINTAVFFLLMFMGFIFKMPDAVETLNRQAYGFTKVSVIFFVVWGIYLLYNVLAFYTPKLNIPMRKPLLLMNLIVTGFLFSFLLHFLIYSDTSMSFSYMLSDIKALFFNPMFTHLHTFMENIKKLTELIVYNPFLFVVNAAVFAIMILGYLMKFIEIQKRQMVMLALLLALTYMNTFFATRFALRDYLWVEIMVNFASLYFAMIILSNIRKHMKPVLFFIAVIFLILFTKNISQCMKVPARVNINYGHYGWKVMFSHIYGRGEKNYSTFMNSRYMDRIENGMVNDDIQYARNYEQNKRTLSFIFPCTEGNTRYMGYVGGGSPVWVDSSDYKIMGFPPELKNSLTVDPSYVLLQAACRLKPEFVSLEEWSNWEYTEYQDKFNKKPKAGILPVYTRLDLSVLLFVHTEDEAAVIGANAEPTNLMIELSNGVNVLKLHGVKIKKYAEIDMSKLKYKYFFVAKTNYYVNYSVSRSTAPAP
ncbi:hypothetical protein [Candidatus Magnetomonas plexicatena]|uniref:hypothetical protein n=1 Tax=Candidatus Magnetomonas plexicatena TaxID=2552947 RepID=UPI0010FFE8E0|nr:hypothetical protein E2O03_012210 [Nitrospirales bacterium LBB_01]